jgi:chromosome segregation ATPase
VPAVADIAFNCPRCRGPLVAEASFAGLASDCPHCFQPIEVPRRPPLNKDLYDEPDGLRRVLREVRDREWETMRRKLHAIRNRAAELEGALRAAELSGATAAGSRAAEEIESLRRQLAEAKDRLAQANVAFAAGRRQHAASVEQLERELAAERERTEALSGETAELRAAMETLRAELLTARRRLTARELQDECFDRAFTEMAAHLGEVAHRRLARRAAVQK